MREWRVQFKKFLKEAYWDWFRWMLLLCLISMGIASLILWWKFSVYPFIVYFGCFWGSFAASWILMFLRRPMRRDFSGDR